ncbi:MAG TPA: hypothetical protein VHM90_20335 [Phycisphaerae bacterium]|nr:hypothetical protein [Phycisphaerae bacterium]
MPFRALLYTLTMLTLVLLAVGMWVRAIAPMAGAVKASTQPTASHPGLTFPTTQSQNADRPDRQFKGLVKATMLASFIAICILLTIGFFATLREWMRFMTRGPGSKAKRTRYVDAWKLAGERAQPEDGGDKEGQGLQ